MQNTDAPLDRPIWLVANIVHRDAASFELEPFEGYAQALGPDNHWVDMRGAPIGEVVALEWQELQARAESRRGIESETNIDAHVYYWDDEWRRENGRAGYFALCSLRHSPTAWTFVDMNEGPFATRADAHAALIGMLAQITNGDAPCR